MEDRGTQENVVTPTPKDPKGGKAVLMLLGLLVIIGGGTLVPSSWYGHKKSTTRKYDSVDFSKIRIAEDFSKPEEFEKNVDGNKDGKVTWAELLGSDATNFQSTSTGARLDPAIQKALDDPNNLTAAFTKNLLVNAAYMRDNNITDEETQNTLLQGAIAEAKEKLVSKVYTYGDINVAKTEDRASIRAYGNTVATILGNIITKETIISDVPGIITYTNSQDTQSLEAIKKTSGEIEQKFSKILTIKVPPSAVIYHLAILNQLAAYRDLVNNLSRIETDPIRASAVIDSYPNILLNTLKIYNNLGQYFRLKNIVFDSNESGYMFTAGYKL